MLTDAAGATPENTNGLQTLTLSSAFQNPGDWGIISGKSYPYLCVQIGGCALTPQVVSGTVRPFGGLTNAGPGVIVAGLNNGALLNSIQALGAVTTGNNGFYYFLLAPNTITPLNQVLTFAPNFGPFGALSGAALSTLGTSVTGLDIFGLAFHAITGETEYSAVLNDLATAEGGNSFVTSLVNNLLPGLQQIDATGSFDIDTNISLNFLTLNAGGQVTESTGAIAALHPDKAARLTARRSTSRTHSPISGRGAIPARRRSACSSITPNRSRPRARSVRPATSRCKPAPATSRSTTRSAASASLPSRAAAGRSSSIAAPASAKPAPRRR